MKAHINTTFYTIFPTVNSFKSVHNVTVYYNGQPARVMSQLPSKLGKGMGPPLPPCPLKSWFQCFWMLQTITISCNCRLPFWVGSWNFSLSTRLITLHLIGLTVRSHSRDRSLTWDKYEESVGFYLSSATWNVLLQDGINMQCFQIPCSAVT